MPDIGSLNLAPSPALSYSQFAPPPQQNRAPSPNPSTYYPPSPQPPSSFREPPLLDPASQHRRIISYGSVEEGPPYKLSVAHPDLKLLASMREVAFAGDLDVRVAWAKQVLKFVERFQSSAGESSRISDPLLVSFTDEALRTILSSAASPSPVPLALYLRGDLAASGTFPSYKAKDAKLAFRDFEAASNLGYIRAWYRIGKAYEDFKDVSSIFYVDFRESRG